MIQQIRNEKAVSSLFIIILFVTIEASVAKGPVLACQDITADVYAGYTYSFPLALQNNGDEALEIRNIITSCHCTVPALEKVTVLPGKTTILPVKYTPNKSNGFFQQSIVLFSNDPLNFQKAVSIKGNIVLPEFESSKKEIRLQTIIGSSDIPAEETVLSSTQKMLFLGAETDPNIFSLDLMQLDDNSFSVKITAKVQAKCGVISDTLKIHFLINDKKESSVQMPLVYTVNPPYTTYPAEVTIINFDEDIHCRLLLKAEKGYNIKIRNVKINGIEGLSADIKKLNEQQFFVYLQGRPRNYIENSNTGLVIELENSISIFIPINRQR